MIQSVDRAARILKVLGSDGPRLGVTELAGHLGLAKTTVYGLLRTLESHGLVEQDAETGKYHLGPALLALGNTFLDNHELRGRSLLWAESLANRAQEAVRVGVLNGNDVLIVHHVFRPDNSVQILEVGAAIPWHACALGKTIVAYLPNDRREGLIGSAEARLTGKTLVEPDDLRAALKEAKDLGYAVDDQEAIIGEASIAAPVLEGGGAPAGAIGVTGPVESILPSGPDVAKLGAVREAARNLSRDLGGGRYVAWKGTA